MMINIIIMTDIDKYQYQLKLCDVVKTTSRFVLLGILLLGDMLFRYCVVCVVCVVLLGVVLLGVVLIGVMLF